MTIFSKNLVAMAPSPLYYAYAFKCSLHKH